MAQRPFDDSADGADRFERPEPGYEGDALADDARFAEVPESDGDPLEGVSFSDPPADGSTHAGGAKRVDWNGVPLFPRTMYPTIRGDLGTPVAIRLYKMVAGQRIPYPHGPFDPVAFRREHIEDCWGDGEYRLELCGAHERHRIAQRTLRIEGHGPRPWPGPNLREQAASDRRPLYEGERETEPEFAPPSLVDTFLGALGSEKALGTIGTVASGLFTLYLTNQRERAAEARAERDRREAVEREDRRRWEAAQAQQMTMMLSMMGQGARPSRSAAETDLLDRLERAEERARDAMAQSRSNNGGGIARSLGELRTLMSELQAFGLQPGGPGGALPAADDGGGSGAMGIFDGLRELNQLLGHVSQLRNAFGGGPAGPAPINLNPTEALPGG